jgi:hypothetical protein
LAARSVRGLRHESFCKSNRQTNRKDRDGRGDLEKRGVIREMIKLDENRNEEIAFWRKRPSSTTFLSKKMKGKLRRGKRYPIP